MAKKTPTVLVFGTFDLLHPGHLAFLSAAAKRGALTVVVTPDAKAAREKARQPFFTERERLAMVAALTCVSRAVLGDRGRDWNVVRRLRPDVICVGHDQRADHPAFLAQLAALPEKPRIVRLRAHRAGRYSSSKVKLEIHRAHRHA
jgi:FAD synthetase